MNNIFIYLRKSFEIILFKYPFFINIFQILRYYIGFIPYLINKILNRPYIGGYLFSDTDSFRGRYENIEKIINHINKTKIKVLEIGCYCGQNTIFMGNLFRNMNINYQITCLDIWNDYDRGTDKLNFFHNKVSENLKNGKVFNLFMQNIKNTNMQKHISIKKRDSFTYLDNIDEKFDLIIIDGSHSYKYVFKDILNAKRLINNNGFIVGDDYEIDFKSIEYLNYQKAIQNNKDTIYCPKSGINFHPGVTKATYELLGNIFEINGQFIVKKINDDFIDYSQLI